MVSWFMVYLSAHSLPPNQKWNLVSSSQGRRKKKNFDITASCDSWFFSKLPYLATLAYLPVLPYLTFPSQSNQEEAEKYRHEFFFLFRKSTRSNGVTKYMLPFFLSVVIFLSVGFVLGR